MQNMRKGAILLLAVMGLAALLFLPDVLGGSLVSVEVETDALASGAFWGALGVAWLGGVLTSLTPCVYPLIPITVAVFGAREARSRLQAIALTLVYIAGMAVMFSGLGYVAASSGKVFGSFLANPWVLTGLGLFFVAMAASMFGAFDIALPSSLALRLNRVGGAGWGGAFAMGLVAGIIAAPCTGPVLASLLTVVATSGQPVFGFVLLFVYALGVGLPFLLLGGFSVSLPKSGPWMEAVKSVFGIALLALALNYWKDAFPGIRSALAGASLPVIVGPIAAFVGILLGAVHRSFYGTAKEKVLKVAGVALVVLGIFVRLGTAGPAGGIEWSYDLDAALARAEAEQKPVMIDFWAEWCAACKELDRHTFTDPEVLAEAENFVTVKIDGTLEDERILALYDRYGVQGLPTVLFLRPDGRPVEDPRVTGFLEGPKFAQEMRKLTSALRTAATP
jgi:thiol:disulfide interchange protein DsbD